ncbi:MAG: hypothetical protein ACFE85_11815 [Candidatus Hodarchaeota archaeon]
MVNFKSIVSNLQKHYSDASEVVVVNNRGKILYSTKNWDVKSDINAVLSSWAGGNAQSVNMNGIRFSVLQMEPERFIATNRQKKGHLIGATTPDGEIYFIAHIKPKAKGWYHLAYPAVARAAAMVMKGSKSKFIETKVEKSDETELQKKAKAISYGATNVPVEPIYIDPTLKAEIQGFLEWIRNRQGLSSYISYSLQQNDNYQISRLAEIYKELYRICNQ